MTSPFLPFLPALRPALLLLVALLGARESAAISRDPNGVNVNSQAATSVFITFGGLVNQVPVEATWCGELVPAAPDIGFRCDPATVFGRLPLRLDQSRLAANGTVFTDIMTIPPSVARRAWQAAERGANSDFFYVRRFVSTVGGPDEYVFVTCRMAGGGARVPLALLDVRLAFATEATVLSIEAGRAPPPVQAEIQYNGTGHLRGRWEIVLPGEDPPASRDLLTEATLPPEERALQRRYTQLERFNVFLPPTGRVVLPGPDPRRIPTQLEGLYHLLLRIEVSDDKEGDSNLALAQAGQGIVHSGAVAGFPIPPLRYYVGSGSTAPLAIDGALQLVAPAAGADWPVAAPLTFSWSPDAAAQLYRLEIAGPATPALHIAIVQQGVSSYRPPDWLFERLASPTLRWRVTAIGPGARTVAETPWRVLLLRDAQE